MSKNCIGVPDCFRFLNLMRCLQFIIIAWFLNRSTYLYDILRPKLIHEANIDLLCELVHILKVEVLGEQSARQSEPLAGLQPTLQRILADVNERLTFRARTYIRDEVPCYLTSNIFESFSYNLFTVSLPCLYFHKHGSHLHLCRNSEIYVLSPVRRLTYYW